MKFDAQTFKTIGGGIIIAAAFAVMFPGFITYAGGLMRVCIFITVTLCLGFVVAFTFSKIRKIGKPRAGGTPTLPGSTPALPETVPSDTTSDT